MNQKHKDPKAIISSDLVRGEALLKILFKEEEGRPSLRWLRTLQSKRLIPFRKIGQGVFFDPVEVRRALDAQFKVNHRGE